MFEFPGSCAGLFPALRVLLDRDARNGQLLLLGSASPALLRQTSESLLGRIEVVEVAGFDLAEVGAPAAHQLWLRGGYPRLFLAASDADSLSVAPGRRARSACRSRRCAATSTH